MRSVFLGTLNWYKTKFFFFFLVGVGMAVDKIKGHHFLVPTHSVWKIIHCIAIIQ